MGLLEVEVVDEAHQSHPMTKQMLLDGGFAVVCENQLKIVSYDAVSPEQTSDEQLDTIRRHIKKDIDSESLDQTLRNRLQRKLALKGQTGITRNGGLLDIFLKIVHQC